MRSRSSIFPGPSGVEQREGGGRSRPSCARLGLTVSSLSSGRGCGTGTAVESPCGRLRPGRSLRHCHVLAIVATTGGNGRNAVSRRRPRPCSRFSGACLCRLSSDVSRPPSGVLWPARVRLASRDSARNNDGGCGHAGPARVKAVPSDSCVDRSTEKASTVQSRIAAPVRFRSAAQDCDRIADYAAGLEVQCGRVERMAARSSRPATLPNRSRCR